MLGTGDAETAAVQRSQRPIIAAEFKGKLFRAVGNKIYPRPSGESFHSFLWEHLRWTVGETFYRGEVKKPAAERHQLVQWFFDLCEWQEKHDVREAVKGSPRGIPPSGDVQALTALAYDVYTLLHSKALPAELVEETTR